MRKTVRSDPCNHEVNLANEQNSRRRPPRIPSLHQRRRRTETVAIPPTRVQQRPLLCLQQRQMGRSRRMDRRYDGLRSITQRIHRRVPLRWLVPRLLVHRELCR